MKKVPLMWVTAFLTAFSITWFHPRIVSCLQFVGAPFYKVESPQIRKPELLVLFSETGKIFYAQQGLDLMVQKGHMVRTANSSDYAEFHVAATREIIRQDMFSYWRAVANKKPTN